MAKVSKGALRKRVGRACRVALKAPDGTQPRIGDKLGRGSGGLGYDAPTLLAKISQISAEIASDPAAVPKSTKVDVPGAADAQALLGKTFKDLIDHITKEIIYDLLEAKHTVTP